MNLLSIQGFDYLLEQSRNGTSKHDLQTFLKSLCIEPLAKEEVEGRKIKELRKASQYQGVLAIVDELGIQGDILEVGCGNGELSRLLAADSGNRIVGVDSNKELIQKQQEENIYGNLKFRHSDAFQDIEINDTGLVIGLHCCGNLSDRVIDAAIANRASVVCVPCCYGKINDRREILPRSATLAQRRKEFHYVLSRVKSLEGYAETGKKDRANLLLDLYRALVNFDRAFYLMEHDYDANFSRITSEKIKSNGKKHRASPVRTAIVARRED